jgi:NDP-sugar pyrophosphorylase family protein
LLNNNLKQNKMNLTNSQIKKKYPSAYIREGVYIREGAIIGKGADIRAGAYIQAGAIIGEGADIKEGVYIREGAIIKEGAVIQAGARIGVGRKNVDQSLVILGIGETKNMTAYRCSDGLIINIGCQNEYKGCPYKEMKKVISKKYEKDHPYFLALKLIKNWYKNL